MSPARRRELNLLRILDGLDATMAKPETSSIHILRIEESAEGTPLADPEPIWQITVHGSGRCQVIQGRSLDEALRVLADGDSKKICRKCQEEKPLNSYSIDRSQEDGRCKACRTCESKRVMEFQRRKRQVDLERKNKTQQASG